MLSFGGSYSPRIAMSRFKKYEGLLADRGRLDVPETYMVGLQFSPTPALSFLLDYQHIAFGGVSALSNAIYDGTKARGSDGGPGNGWRDVDVYKLGVRYQVTQAIRVSAGTSWSNGAFEDKYTTSNINTPATFRRHYTIGAGYKTESGAEWGTYFSIAPRHTTTGPSGLASGVASQLTGTPTVTGQEKLSTQQWVLGVQVHLPILTKHSSLKG